MAKSRKVIITCAITGSIHTPSMSPHIPVTPDELDEFDGLALLDVQPSVFGEKPPAPVRSLDVVIDHHPERSAYDAVLKDIRPRYGATSTILTEYPRAAALATPPKLSTALVHGTH